MDEWNVCYVAWGTSEKLPEPIEGEYFDLFEQTFALKDALFAAGVFHAMFRECRHVTFANLAQMVNANGMLVTGPDELLKTSVFHAFDLYANHTGETAVATRVEARDGVVPSFIAEDVRNPEPRYVGLRETFVRFRYPNAPYLDAQATLGRNAGTLYVSVINYHPSEALSATLDFGEAAARSQGPVALYELNGDDTLTPNTFGRPDVTRLTTRTLPGLPTTYEFPAHSATVLEISLGQ
jgi:alpha-N-arabinofuranosidase